MSVLLPLVFAAFFYITARKAMLYYPHLIASTRKNSIDLTIQHSVTYLYAMSMGGLTLNESLKSLGKQADIYGEAAKELGRIARDTELLGKSSLEAINNLMDTTPSGKMADFLKGLVSVIRSKGDLADYFRLKAKQYHSEAEIEQKMFLEMLGSLSEAYVVALVAGPMFLIVIGIVMGMVGSGFNNALFAVIYGIIPLASIAFIVLINSMSRITPENPDVFVYQKELKAFKDVPQVPADAEKAGKLSRIILKRKKLRELANPLKMFYLYPEKALYAGVFIGLAYLTYNLWKIGINPDSAGKYLLFSTLIAAIPFTVFFEIKSYKIRQIENRMPAFLRALANASESGLTLIKSIEMILSSEAGALADEIRKVWRDVKWGTPVNMSLYRMSYRVRTAAMTRIVSLVVKASEATGNIAAVMNIAAEEAESESKLRQERLSNTIVYLIIIYMTFFCFLFIALVLSKSFLPMMPGAGGNAMGFGAGLDAAAIKRLMFHAASMNGFFSGLMIGQIVSGTPASGLKHSIIMLLMAYFTFGFLV